MISIRRKHQIELINASELSRRGRIVTSCHQMAQNRPMGRLTTLVVCLVAVACSLAEACVGGGCAGTASVRFLPPAQQARHAPAAAEPAWLWEPGPGAAEGEVFASAEELLEEASAKLAAFNAARQRKWDHQRRRHSAGAFWARRRPVRLLLQQPLPQQPFTQQPLEQPPLPPQQPPPQQPVLQPPLSQQPPAAQQPLVQQPLPQQSPTQQTLSQLLPLPPQVPLPQQPSLQQQQLSDFGRVSRPEKAPPLCHHLLLPLSGCAAMCARIPWCKAETATARARRAGTAHPNLPAPSLPAQLHGAAAARSHPAVRGPPVRAILRDPRDTQGGAGGGRRTAGYPRHRWHGSGWDRRRRRRRLG